MASSPEPGGGGVMQTAALREPQPTVEARNKRVLDYVGGRLCDSMSAGQCILHLNPGGEIRRIEWRSVDNVSDIIDS